MRVDGHADPPEHRRDLRLRSDRGRHVLLRDGIPAGAEPAKSWSIARARCRRAGRAPVAASGRHLARKPTPSASSTATSSPATSSPASGAGITTSPSSSISASSRDSASRRNWSAPRRMGAITGSPAYMSPEQGIGKPLDARTDVYSLGAVAYFLVTGQMPLIRDNPMQIILAHAHDEVTPPRALRPGLPGRTRPDHRRCLEKDPANRFQSVDDLESRPWQNVASRNPGRRVGARLWWEEYERGRAEAPTAAGRRHLRETVQLARREAEVGTESEVRSQKSEVGYQSEIIWGWYGERRSRKSAKFNGEKS